MNFDRGMIKWQPFDSVISGKSMVKSIMDEKNKKKMPVLSDEEIDNLEQKIINAFYIQNDINLMYYKNGNFYNIVGKIKKIDQVNKTIYLNNTLLLFSQIISITF